MHLNNAESLIESNQILLFFFYCESNRSEFAKIALESIRCLPKDSQLFFTVIGQTEDFACVSMCILSILIICVEKYLKSCKNEVKN